MGFSNWKIKFMTTPTSTPVFAYDTYTVTFEKLLSDPFESNQLESIAANFASLAFKGNLTGLVKKTEAVTSAAGYSQIYGLTLKENQEYAVVGLASLGEEVKFGVVSFNTERKITNINFFKVIGDDVNALIASDSFIGIKNDVNVVFGLTTTGFFMLPPKSFFLEGIHANPFEPFPEAATAKNGLACIASNIIALQSA